MRALEARRRPTEDKGKVATPRTPPKGKQHHATEDKGEISSTQYTIRAARNVEIVPKRRYHRFRPARMFACSIRRYDALSAGPPSKRFSMNQQQQQTIIRATTCGSGQGNGTFDSCRQLREIFRNYKETQQISKNPFRIPKLLYRKSIFELSREVLLFFFLFFFFLSYLLMFSLFFFFFSKKKKTFLTAEPKKSVKPGT